MISKKDEEIWIAIPEYKNTYSICKLGIVWSNHERNKGKPISYRIDRAGYYTLRLSKNGKCSTKYLHRLLAEVFISNPENKGYVNHINGNKLDNRLENIEWTTHSENIKHAYKIGLAKVPDAAKKGVVDTCTGKVYSSIKEASTVLSVSYSSLKNKLNGNRKNNTCLQLAA